MALPKVKVMVSNSKLTLQETIVYFMNYIFSNHDVQQSVHNIGSYHVAMHNLSCDFHITVMSANVHLSRSHYQSSLELALYPGPRSEHGKGLVTLGRFLVCAESACYVNDYIPYQMHSKFTAGSC